VSRRVGVAFHEAGHAVAALHEGVPFRYATVAARRPGVAGLVMIRPGRRHLEETERWAAPMVVAAAGMVASASRFAAVGTALDGAARRKILAEGSGGFQFDLQQLRWHARRTWWAHRVGVGDRGAGFDPEWAADPAGVEAIAAAAWARTVHLITEAYSQVADVAWELHVASGVTQAQVREVARAATADDAEERAECEPGEWEAAVSGQAALVGSGFWPAQFTRLRWRPAAGWEARERLERGRQHTP
jgi:hypothetical protein